MQESSSGDRREEKTYKGRWPEVTIRFAGHADINALVDMWVELTDFHRQLDSFYTVKTDAESRMAEYFAKQVQNPKAIVLVAESGEAVVGFLMADIAAGPPVFEGPEYLMISDACVRATARRSGIGESMVRRLFDLARERGIDRVDVGFAACNTVSSSFWTKMGFKPFSIRSTLNLPSK